MSAQIIQFPAAISNDASAKALIRKILNGTGHSSPEVEDKYLVGMSLFLEILMQPISVSLPATDISTEAGAEALRKALNQVLQGLSLQLLEERLLRETNCLHCG
jgi:hypothetical protein